MSDMTYGAARMPPPYDPVIGSASIKPAAASQPIIKRIAAWFLVVHVLGCVVAPWYVIAVQFAWQTFAMAFVMGVLCHFAIRAGSHGLDAHKSFKARAAYEIFVTIFFSATFQYSRLLWAYMHRLHHAFTDTALDPHSALYGFRWAHMEWVLRTSTAIERPALVRDLARNPFVKFQHRHQYLLAYVSGLAVPTLIASFWGDPWGGLFVGGFMRLVVQYHTTWSINSVAHTCGERRYGPIGSARANRWLSLPTVGEGGDHGWHHLVEWSARIGRDWRDLDFGYYCWILPCSWARIIYGVRVATKEEVEELALRARLRVMRPTQAA